MSEKKPNSQHVGLKDRQAYKRRHALRQYAAIALVALIAIVVGNWAVQAWWIGGPVIGHLMFMVFGLGITGGVWWLLESQDPDPDPAAAKIEAERWPAQSPQHPLQD